MADTFHILITGEETDLRPRLPTRAGDVGLQWTILPVLEFERLPVDAALFESLEQYDWLLFSSPRSVNYWSEALLAAGQELRPETRIACMGKRTAEIASQDGYTPDYVPSSPGTEGFVAEFGQLVPSGQRVLVPQPLKGRGELVNALSRLGCHATELPLYRTRQKEKIALPPGVGIDSMDLLLFTSPSSVRGVLTNFEINRSQPVACLGTYTEAELLREGFGRTYCLRGADFDTIGDIVGELRC